MEWFNTLMGIFWGLINPEMFVTVADTLEDVMQASVPRVIGACSSQTLSDLPAYPQR